jgi:hypothetical protein
MIEIHIRARSLNPPPPDHGVRIRENQISVRREKALCFSGCDSRPANRPTQTDQLSAPYHSESPLGSVAKMSYHFSYRSLNRTARGTHWKRMNWMIESGLACWREKSTMAWGGGL